MQKAVIISLSRIIKGVPKTRYHSSCISLFSYASNLTASLNEFKWIDGTSGKHHLSTLSRLVVTGRNYSEGALIAEEGRAEANLIIVSRGD